MAGASLGYVTIKYNAGGNEIWVLRPPADSKRSVATDLAVDNAGNVFVTGNLYPAADLFPHSIRVGTIKYNAAGIQQWMKVYEGEGVYFDDKVLSSANEIVSDKLGNVYITINDSLQNDTGHETLLTRINRNLVTIKYDGDGNEIWLEKLLVRSIDTTSFIGLDDYNNVYVSGMQDGYGTNKDFVLAMYSQMKLITRNNNTKNKLTIDATGFKANAFPNPFDQNFTLRWSGKNLPVNIMMTDATGKLLDKKTNLAGSGHLQAGSNFPSGLYFIKLIQEKETVILKLIIH
ncbi:MAG: T9SS type A sorting domain-containing protein [Bacteroidota bacterium]